MSAEYHGEPAPSMMCPLRITMSYGADLSAWLASCLAEEHTVRTAKTTANALVARVASPRKFVYASFTDQNDTTLSIKKS
jgi:hypothetical protein